MICYQICQVVDGEMQPVVLIEQPIAWIKRGMKFDFLPIMQNRTIADEAVKALNKDNPVKYAHRPVKLPD